MAAKHDTPEHRAARRRYQQLQAAGEWLTCAEQPCLYPTRDIAPHMKVDVAHNPAGTEIIGPAHRRCNRSEGATRGNRMRGKTLVRWVL